MSSTFCVYHRRVLNHTPPSSMYCKFARYFLAPPRRLLSVLHGRVLQPRYLFVTNYAPDICITFIFSSMHWSSSASKCRLTYAEDVRTFWTSMYIATMTSVVVASSHTLAIPALAVSALALAIATLPFVLLVNLILQVLHSDVVLIYSRREQWVFSKSPFQLHFQAHRRQAAFIILPFKPTFYGFISFYIGRCCNGRRYFTVLWQ